MPTPSVIDISKWQGPMNFGMAKATGIAAVFMRASCGCTPDPLFVQHWTGARAAGMVLGAYHYLEPDHGLTQIDVFLQIACTHPTDLPLALDCEKSGHVSSQELTDLIWESLH